MMKPPRIATSMPARQFVIGSVAALLATVGLLSAPSPAFASCNPGRAVFAVTNMAGTSVSPSTTPTGIMSNIDEYSPYVSVNSVSTAWVMLDRDGTWYAQVGWWRRYISPGVFKRVAFSQYYLPGLGMVTREGTTHAVGTSTAYKVTYDTGTQIMRMYDGTTVLDSATTTAVPNNDQVFGETKNHDDQMPGGTGAHVKFLYTYEQHSPSITWYTVNTPAQTVAPYGASHPSAGRYDIWDTGCSS